jgi:hypothetical protein
VSKDGVVKERIVQQFRIRNRKPKLVMEFSREELVNLEVFGMRGSQLRIE